MLRVPGPSLWMVPIVLSAWGIVQIMEASGSQSLDVPAQPPAAVAGSAAPEPNQAAVVAAARHGLARSEPKRLVIKSIWINAEVDQVGLARNGMVETPSYERANNVAWYRHGATPGEAGAAVILGHVDSKKDRAVFFELRRIKPGAQIEVARADGSKAVFKVDSVEQFAKSAFPTERVYGPTFHPTLRLVTCGGRYNTVTEDYTDNIIVFATIALQ